METNGNCRKNGHFLLRFIEVVVLQLVSDLYYLQMATSIRNKHEIKQVSRVKQNNVLGGLLSIFIDF